jgi:1-acyl-sn-glycerol-3-phosphate acyltransferase
MRGWTIVTVVLVYLLFAAAARLVLTARVHRRFAARLLQVASRFLLRLTKIRLHVIGTPPPELHTEGEVRLLISNHLSYVDVWALATQIPICFVTSVEVRDSGVLGTICKIAGCLFVERRSKAALKSELGVLTQTLREVHSLGIFPEGTSSNGDQVLPFKGSLFQTALLADATILPVCLRYTRANDLPITPETRDAICFYDDMEFFDHFSRMRQLRSIDLELEFLEPITGAQIRQVSDDIGIQRKWAAQTARERIQSRYRPILGI